MKYVFQEVVFGVTSRLRYFAGVICSSFLNARIIIHLMKSYWGKMISLGADTYWEAFDPDQPADSCV